MTILDIHVEGIEPKDFPEGNVNQPLKNILMFKVPVVLSLPSWMEDYWLREKNNLELIELVKEAVIRPGSALGQQGNLHKCHHPHKLVDPWHENSCIWRSSPSRQQQEELMKRGRERLEKLIGITPIVYCPPNHQFNRDTLEVAERTGYHFFTDRAMISLKPYNLGSMIIVPEADLDRKRLKTSMVYIHYDEIERIGNRYGEAVRDSEPLVINPRRVSKSRITLNRALKTGYKIARDLIKLPKRLK